MICEMIFYTQLRSYSIFKNRNLSQQSKEINKFHTVVTMDCLIGRYRDSYESSASEDTESEAEIEQLFNDLKHDEGTI